MAERIWTKEQLMAITADDCDLLVCAAAGSGKTAVLTERIIRSICADDPVSITQMLVVTFTKAAAAELKEKISKAIVEKMGKEQGSKRLSSQLLALDRAQISTIDSFCLKLISGYFCELGLPASVRVGDSAELELLKKDTMERFIDESYTNENHDITILADNFSALRDNKLSEKLIEIYDSVVSYPEGVEFIRDVCENMQNSTKDFDSSKYAEQIVKYANVVISHFEREYSLAFSDLDSSCEPAKAMNIFSGELAKLHSLAKAKTYQELCDELESVKFESLSGNKVKSVQYEKMCEVRDNYKKKIREIQKEVVFKPEIVHVSAEMSAAICQSLYRFLKAFDSKYSEEKLSREMLDFADVERYAHKLLIKDGKPTEVAVNVAKNYKQIYIDEYQDSNKMQDEIFASIASANRFIVGDIKQSIYAFRGAMPDIFADYRQRYPDYDEKCHSDSAKVFLSHNFRSSKEIMYFVNTVFGSLFDPLCSNTPYDRNSDELRFPENKVSEPSRVSVSIIRKEDSYDAEARFVANEIQRLVNDEGYKPSDIAILLRSMSSDADVFKRELKSVGIKVQSTVSENFLDTPEALLVTSVLGTIDNPRRDIYLAAALKSPIFGFTLDDLIEIKRHGSFDSLYDALVYAKDNKEDLSEKIAAFFDWLAEMRAFAKDNAVDRLVRRIYTTTAIYAVVRRESPSDGAKNLQTFYSFARSYESGAFRGLHSFMRYIADAKEQKISPDSGTVEKSDDCVQLMSIHKSKGLEFPVVFVSKCAKRINTDDIKSPILLDKNIGIAFKLRDETGYSVYNPVHRVALSQKILENIVDEELRVLYVALTRPKNYLYVTATDPEPQSLVEWAEKTTVDRHILLTKRRYIDWILPACVSSDSANIELICADDVETEDVVETSDKTDTVDVDVDLLCKRAGQRYKYEEFTQLPSKVSVSSLFPEFLDENEVTSTYSYKYDSKPDFLDPAARATSTQKGIATHLFMQFCDFENVRKNGVSLELARLCDKGFIDVDNSKLVDVRKLERFFDSNVFKRMCNSSEIYREQRFIISMSAGDFTSDDEYAKRIDSAEIIVQGVIDCFFRQEDGTFCILDYKTDKVSGFDDPEEMLRKEYQNQLMYYTKAVKSMTGEDVGRVCLYAFDLGKEVDFPELV